MVLVAVMVSMTLVDARISGGESYSYGSKAAPGSGSTLGSPAAAARGYGRDRPAKPLSINLTPEVEGTGSSSATEGSLSAEASDTKFQRVANNNRNPSASSSGSTFYASSSSSTSSASSSSSSSTTAAAAASSSSSSSSAAASGCSNSGMMMMGGEIPGTAGIDYPALAAVPLTKFNCRDQQSGGYYADVETRCQVFHVCHDYRKSSFLCPNGTVFDQQNFVCNWYFNVNCATSVDWYSLNAQIGVTPEPTERQALATYDPFDAAHSYHQSNHEPIIDSFGAASSQKQSNSDPSLDSLVVHSSYHQSNREPIADALVTDSAYHKSHREPAVDPFITASSYHQPNTVWQPQLDDLATDLLPPSAALTADEEYDDYALSLSYLPPF